MLSLASIGQGKRNAERRFRQAIRTNKHRVASGDRSGNRHICLSFLSMSISGTVDAVTIRVERIR
jgi:hypothetical protein